MAYTNSFNPIESICSIIETYFCLERKSHSRQKFKEQINDELVLILKKAIDLSENPKFTLIQLGLIVFPGSIAIKKKKNSCTSQTLQVRLRVKNEECRMECFRYILHFNSSKVS